MSSVSRFVVHGSIAAAAHSPATPAGRYGFNGVHFTTRGIGDKVNTLACATNGKILASVVVKESADSEPLPPLGVLLPADKFSTSKAYRAEINDSVSVTELRGVRRNIVGDTAAVEPIDANFPPAESVVPKAEDFQAVVCLDAELLAKLAKALSDGGESSTVRLYIGRPDKPIGVVATNNNIGVITPCCRSNTREKTPDIAPTKDELFNWRHLRECHFGPVVQPVAAVEHLL